LQFCVAKKLSSALGALSIVLSPPPLQRNIRMMNSQQHYLTTPILASKIMTSHRTNPLSSVQKPLHTPY